MSNFVSENGQKVDYKELYLYKKPPQNFFLKKKISKISLPLVRMCLLMITIFSVFAVLSIKL